MEEVEIENRLIYGAKSCWSSLGRNRRTGGCAAHALFGNAQRAARATTATAQMTWEHRGTALTQLGPADPAPGRRGGRSSGVGRGGDAAAAGLGRASGGALA